ncbi:DUF3301 domain-containing protein [Motilimonas pumila]|uniref:DUF3301 domain-containing protein n=1 Tax=Motilimonas pumila TaxID=2303987 RepID=A0A418YJN5_9GAMM|nr:DUF3301 domain-containing protein [Motilimonas pumila]RJG51194.1 DUF3301 domain-containing protein [Motilimonas pumila]
MKDLLILFAVFLICMWFWQQRKQSERAKVLITKHCESLNLQLLSVAQKNICFRPGADFFRYTFEFEFSSDTESCYVGMLYLNGEYKYHFELPPYRV